MDADCVIGRMQLDKGDRVECVPIQLGLFQLKQECVLVAVMSEHII
jgi:hypothetical protein